MRLDSIDLIRFGHFCDRRIDLPARQPDFYLIYGDNEAGKSTLLRGISALFFGVPVKTPDVHTYKGPELRIGATISQGKDRFSFRRRKGTSGTLLNSQDSQIPEDALEPFLRELDQERFEQFFGLTHDRLREGGEALRRGQGDVGSALFQAAGSLDLRRLAESLDGEARDLFSAKSRTRKISRTLEEYRQAKAEVRRLAISGATVKQKQTELEATRQALEKLKNESHSLQQDLVRLRRIESNKPDLARLQELRTALAALESVPTLPADARKQRDDAAAALAHANSQIAALTRDIAQRERRIQELPANSLLSVHEAEINDLNTGAGAYVQSVTDRAKRLRELEDAIQLAQTAWSEVWSQPVSEAENLRTVYSSKEQILALVAEHKGLTAELKTAEDELRNVTQEQERLQEQLAQHSDPSDPAALLAAIDHAKSLGDTDLMAARLRAEIERLMQDARRQMRKLAPWQGTIEELEDLKTPLLATIDQYSREWERVTAKRKDLEVRHAGVIELIEQKEGELGSLTAQIAEAGEANLANVRARRDQLWELVRASVIDKTISTAEAKKQSGSSGSLADTFAAQLRKADEIADLRFANARDVVIHDRLVKEIAAGSAEQQRIEQQIEQVEEAERELRERWSSEWSTLGVPPLSPLEMKEWMQLRQSILVQLEQSRERENEVRSLQERISSAAAQIRANWASTAAASIESLPVL
ncbi:MAG TPA: AAA family ATPase, partial [Candidatus Angelobacter sp.]|nr:AAA family ATPase [Candidatus Angelobacter sp.]